MVYDSGHEPSNEEELKAYQTLFGMREETPGEAGQPFTTHPPPPPPPMEPDAPSLSPTLEDQVQDLTSRLDALWDETQEHRVTMSKDMDALRADIRTVLRNQQVIQQQLAQQLTFHLPLPPPQCSWDQHRSSHPSFILLPMWTLSFFLGGGGGGGGGWSG